MFGAGSISALPLLIDFLENLFRLTIKFAMFSFALFLTHIEQNVDRVLLVETEAVVRQMYGLDRRAFDQNCHEPLEAIFAERFRFIVVKNGFIYFFMFVPGALGGLFLQLLRFILYFQGKIKMHSSEVEMSQTDVVVGENSQIMNDLLVQKWLLTTKFVTAEV